MTAQILAVLSGSGAVAFAGLAIWLALGRGSARVRAERLKGELMQSRGRLTMAVAEHVAYQRHVQQQLAAKEQTIDSYDSLLGLAADSGGDPHAMLAALVLPGQGNNGAGGRPETGSVPTGEAGARLAAVTASLLGPKKRGGVLGRITGTGRGARPGTRDPLDT